MRATRFDYAVVCVCIAPPFYSCTAATSVTLFEVGQLKINTACSIADVQQTCSYYNIDCFHSAQIASALRTLETTASARGVHLCAIALAEAVHSTMPTLGISTALAIGIGIGDLPKSIYAAALVLCKMKHLKSSLCKLYVKQCS